MVSTSADRTFLNNKPDIIIRYHKGGTCSLIDVAVSGNRNVVKTAAEEILKYKDLTIEIQRMWTVKTKIQRPYNRNTANVVCKNKGNTINNRGK
jgi:hypothetical protein